MPSKARPEEQEEIMQTTVTTISDILKKEDVHPIKKACLADELEDMARECRADVEKWKKEDKNGRD